jgi:subtilase family serine protease
MLMMIVALLIAGIPLSAIPVQAAGDIQKYLIPVDVKNLGGSDAGPCTLSLFLDGEKMAVHTIKEGIPAGQTVTVKLNVATSPGTHQVRVVVDEEQKVPDKTRSNNEAQGRYAFP